ncbi:MAG: glycosyltransferase [Desulfobacteraceae bacterium]|nr:MAG: glycosyltransferase [Desulfobacteraceae bacterium]
MKLSVVASMYMSEPYLREFYTRCVTAASKVAGADFEIVLVNDGSPDESLAAALKLRERDERVIIIDLSRNFGHHKAIMTGLMHARGERVFLIDCDLEEPPEVLPDWWNRLDQDPGLDVIFGAQFFRKGKWFERVSGWFFYRIINLLSQVKLPTNVIVARLMTARYVRALIKHKDREIYLFGLLAFCGFRQEPVEVPKQHKGSSTYTLIRRLSLFFNAVTSFTNAPLYAIFYAGISISTLSFLFVLFLIIKKLIYADTIITGWTSIAVSIWLVAGFVLTALGVIGIYLAKVFSETKPRPYTIVRHIYR